MKKIAILLAVFATAVLAQTAPATYTIIPPPADVATATALAKMTKERDDAVAQAKAATAQQQQQAIAAEYYKAVAERNEALLRLQQTGNELTLTKEQLAAATKRADELQKELAKRPPAVVPAK